MVQTHPWGVCITQEGVNEHFSGAPKHSLGVALHSFPHAAQMGGGGGGVGVAF